MKLSLHEEEARVIVRWCLGCFAEDALAVAMAEGDAEENDDKFSEAYLALCDRIFLARGADVLKQCVEVRRDVGKLKLTLRGPGRLWGRLSPR